MSFSDSEPLLMDEPNTTNTVFVEPMSSNREQYDSYLNFHADDYEPTRTINFNFVKEYRRLPVNFKRLKQAVFDEYRKGMIFGYNPKLKVHEDRLMEQILKLESILVDRYETIETTTDYTIMDLLFRSYMTLYATIFSNIRGRMTLSHYISDIVSLIEEIRTRYP